jgi:hypothetical protein
MRRIALAAGASILAAACSPAPPSDIVFPHAATRVDGVCAPGGAPSGLSVSVEEPYKNTGLRRFRITNGTSSPHEVRTDFMIEKHGPCDGSWALGRRLELEDASTCETPGSGILAPNASIEVRIPPRRVTLHDACTKIGLALITRVDGQRACIELGSWIAHRADAD